MFVEVIVVSRRSGPNWIAFGCAISYMLCFLALPFYRILVVYINGWNFIQQNAVMALPLLLGTLMALSSTMLERNISIVIAAVSVLTTFVLMLAGKNLLVITTVIQQNLSAFLSNSINITNSIALQLTIGSGAILSLLLSIIFLVTELVHPSPKTTCQYAKTDEFDF